MRRIYFRGSLWRGVAAAGSRPIGYNIDGPYVLSTSVVDSVIVAGRLIWYGCMVIDVQRDCQC
jgi:hypothetical protein